MNVKAAGALAQQDLDSLGPASLRPLSQVEGAAGAEAARDARSRPCAMGALADRRAASFGNPALNREI